mmetsp:Transcript_16373/g.28069  ORF Transcript_16373/g.28069 Transcript_16373/m.28069 type:complete len:284 (+) Transcript_16373:120-971(+)|eukprot:CAMPEP_0119105012 /NCGR_PEP_ID=MMETSP1180-20130426/3079_1 /TAXON_ID=3052 ORGANISM="Chlamydomonas cf sp, Strain CCMP681" /NCGR_SAMPLE_ID=MMETSP1180 /ASSEMBLY_ACC=CAM_ASM_000741 /LENGTH=283 /DNA_ID=CAMNT_0007089933 /DNA_START=132 /DNA_END=983 /DNA_ORIENTATION=+
MLKNQIAGASSRSAVSVRTSRSVVCQAAPASATAWTAWDGYMSKRGAAKQVTAAENKLLINIGEAVSKSSVGYKPKFSSGGAKDTFKVSHMAKIEVKEVAKDMRDKLEAIGATTLKETLGLDGELDYANITHTTTDISGALSLTGTIVQKGSDKTAVVVLVATETERTMSWSRLEGLIMHWASSSAPGGEWTKVPEGWTATPSKITDAGGAWECQFQKQTMSGQEVMYVLTMQIPLRGVLKSGGVVFVLKGTGLGNASERWLKDASTNQDFFLDLSKFPTTKV